MAVLGCSPLDFGKPSSTQHGTRSLCAVLETENVENSMNRHLGSSLQERHRSFCFVLM